MTIASPLFAKYERGVIRAGSFGCGHWNQFLAVVGDAAVTRYEEFCDKGGENRGLVWSTL